MEDYKEIFMAQLNELNKSWFNPDTKYFTEMDELLAKSRQYGFLDLEIRVLGSFGITYTATHQQDKAEQVYAEIGRLISNSNDPMILAMGNLIVGTYHWNYCKFDKAVEYLEKSSEYYKSLNDEYNTIFVAQNLGVAYYKLNDYKKAFEYLNFAYINIGKVDNLRVKGSIYSWFGILHNEIGLVDKAFELLLKSDELFKESRYYYGYATNQNSVGLIYFNIGNYEKAIICFREAARCGREGKADQIVADSLNNISMVYDSQGDLQSGIKYALESLELRRKCGPDDKLLTTLCVLARSLMLGDILTNIPPLLDEALLIANKINTPKNFFLCYKNYSRYYLMIGELDKALDYAQKCLKIGEEIQNNPFIDESYGLLISYYQKIGDFSKALDYSEKSRGLMREIFGAETKSKVENFHYQYEIMSLKTEYEAKLQREKINAALAMAVTANHEINQPLMIIQGNIEMFIGSFHDFELTEHQERYLQKINNGMDRIRDILTSFKTKTEINFTDYSDEEEMVEITFPSSKQEA